MGFVVWADEPWIRAIIKRHEWGKGRPDVGVGHWTTAEWRVLEHLHQQQHRHQHQLQQQHHRHQHQQRQEMFRYRQQQQRYHFQQQQEIFRRQQHLQPYQPETAKKVSEAQVQARPDGGEAQAETSGALPSSQTTLKPPSLSEYSAMMLSVSQLVFREDRSIQDAHLENMESGLLRKPAQKQEELERVDEESERPRQPMQPAQPRPCPPVERAGGDEMGVLGEEQVVAGCVASYEEQRLSYWEDSKTLLEWWRPLAEGAELEDLIARLEFPFDDDGGVLSGGRLVLEDGEQAPTPLLLLQHELLAPTPQEPWPPPMMAAEHGSGGGGSGESGLEVEMEGSNREVNVFVW